MPVPAAFEQDNRLDQELLELDSTLFPSSFFLKQATVRSKKTGLIIELFELDSTLVSRAAIKQDS